MNGLETVIPNRQGKDPEFQHLQTYFKGGSSKSVGTLSQSEWEATSKYRSIIMILPTIFHVTV